MGKLLLWVRRNSRRAAALALAPGLLVLAGDAWVEHYLGREGENPLQFVPVGYGVAAFALLALIVWPRRRAVFTWGTRFVGAAGVGVGLWGAYLHFGILVADVDGKWTTEEGGLNWNVLEGAVEYAPPLVAPLSFAALGGLLLVLTWSRLSLRVRVGQPEVRVVPLVLPEVPAPSEGERKAG